MGGRNETDVRQVSSAAKLTVEAQATDSEHLPFRNAERYTFRMTQIAVKLPDALVKRLDDLVDQGVFPNRSSAVRSAVEAIIARQHRDALEQAYAEGYRRLPDSTAELAEARRLAEQAIDEEPWDKWW